MVLPLQPSTLQHAKDVIKALTYGLATDGPLRPGLSAHVPVSAA